jgi:hypothetical protein
VPSETKTVITAEPLRSAAGVATRRQAPLPRFVSTRPAFGKRDEFELVALTLSDAGANVGCETVKSIGPSMLKCGMTQQDISDLLVSEVDWVAGAITRKRSKSADHKSVLTVKYVLWSETVRLLRQERATEGPRALTNEHGGPLKVESLGAGSKLAS